MKRISAFFLKRKLLSVFILLLLAIVLFKGTIYRACFSYKITGERNATTISSYPSIISSENSFNAEEIINGSLDTTAALLSFTTDKCSTNSFLLRHGGKTNCIGYAGLCSLLCNLKSGGELESRDCIAEIYFFGYNVHHLFSSAFWKDHDVVLIANKKTQERILLDPTLYDYTGVGIVKERKE